MRSIAPNLVILAVSLGLSILMAEMVLRRTVASEAFRYSWNEDFWIARHAGAGCLSADAVGGDIEPDPHLGWRMRRGFSADGISHSSGGVRGPLPDGGPPPGARPVVAIGDSFTYGLGLSDADTYPAQLSRMIGRPVANFGVNGYGIDQALLLWEREAVRLAPDVVVLGYFTDDFHRSPRRIGEFAKPRLRVEANGTMVLEPVADCRALAGELDAWRVPVLLSWAWRQLMDETVGPPEDLLAPRRALSRALLARLDASVRAAGARLLVLLIPGCAYPEDGHYGDWIIRATRHDCTDLGIACIDLTDEVAPELFGDNCHWSEAGARRAADRVADAIGGAGAG